MFLQQEEYCMAIKRITPLDGQTTILVTGNSESNLGSAGVRSQLGGQAMTVSGIANATGGISAGNLIEADV